MLYASVFMNPKLKILILESDEAIAADLQQKVKQLGFESCSKALPDSPIDQLESLNPELAILGPSLDAETCLKCIHKLKILDPLVPVLISCADLCQPEPSAYTPFNDIYRLSSAYNQEEISSTIDAALKHKAECEHRPDLPILIGQTQEMIDIRQKIRTISEKDINLLITGETGTGKELLARSIHFYSQRNEGPLVKISCGALPDQLLESEVFGFQRGAFTGAHKTKPGRIELAHEGTLFIDEIGALSLSLQGKFLQVLEDREFSRLGGTREKMLDIRVVAATNADLRTMVHENTFRKDLFYRLNNMHIKVSPLRERKGDIPLLTHYFLNKYCYELKKNVFEMPEHVTNFFLSYHWPGNVRELENVIRRAIVLRDWNFIFDELNLDTPTQQGELGTSTEAYSAPVDWPDARIKEFLDEPEFSLKKISKTYVSEAEREMILKALKETEWNRKKAAKQLGVSYKTLLNRIEEFNLKP
jgi:two-component system response regulator AtoC